MNRGNIQQGDTVKKEYDFSNGVRGKFFEPGANMNLPIYLDEDVADFIKKYSRKAKVDAQTFVNNLLRSNKEMIQSVK